jgi:hypothetical protein
MADLAFNGKGITLAQQRIQTLEDQVKHLGMEKAILKKSAALLAEDGRLVMQCPSTRHSSRLRCCVRSRQCVGVATMFGGTGHGQWLQSHLQGQAKAVYRRSREAAGSRRIAKALEG